MGARRAERQVIAGDGVLCIVGASISSFTWGRFRGGPLGLWAWTCFTTFYVGVLLVADVRRLVM